MTRLSVWTLLTADGSPWPGTGWYIAAVASGVCCGVRSWRSRLLVTPSGLTVRNVLRTHVLAWRDIRETRCGGWWRPTTLRIETNGGRRIYVDAILSARAGRSAGYRRVTEIATQLTDIANADRHR